VDVLLSIGEFSKMTYLSVKALRHYHEVGLLAPTAIDPMTGYRRYASSQVQTAQAIRRFRDLDMPIDDVRQVLAATDPADRNRVIVQHLERMRQQLERTQLSVASLQALLEEEPRDRTDIELRRLPATPALVARQVVAFDACGAWLEPTLARLHTQLAIVGLTVDGPDGALYPDEFFEAGEGEVTAYVPVRAAGRATIELPATNVAVLVHDGPFNDLDQTYGALGTIVAERGIGAPGPIRERYLTPASTEVCWPITVGTNQ
jgi:DNA-binding transcriptional MerR regulator